MTNASGPTFGNGRQAATTCPYRWYHNPITSRRGNSYSRGVVIVPGAAIRPSEGLVGGRRPARILVVDRQPLFLAAVGELLSGPPLRARVALATTTTEAIALLDRAPVEMVICDLSSRPASGLEVVALVAACPHPAPVVLLADSERTSELIANLQCGAIGFFTKDSRFQDFIEGVEAVLAGHYAVGSNLVEPALARLRGAPLEEPASPLSPTELVILKMIGQAYSLDAIATARGISKKTVRNHLAAIYRKLELRSRTEAMLWAVRTGLVTSDPVRD